jgi:hypothetical protein
MWGSLTSKVIFKIINIIVFHYALDISKKRTAIVDFLLLLKMSRQVRVEFL